jgi:hypothetical protein
MQAFFDMLFSEGRVRLASDQPPRPPDVEAAADDVLRFERQYRLNLAGTPPAPSRGAVCWGAACLYRAAQFLVYRDLGPALLKRDLSSPCPEQAKPEVCYGVDLCFRFLPDLIRLARAAAQSDPLVEQLMAWSGQWPLSSVGVSGVTCGAIDGFIADESLRLLYVDRIIATKDTSRLADERVREAVRAALGAFPELSSEIAAALNPPPLEAQPV